MYGAQIDRALVYVPNSMSDTVSVISQRTLKVIATFPTGGPVAQGLAVLLACAGVAICAAVLSGFPLEGLVFGGFLPRASEARAHALQSALGTGTAYAWYESPQRILATLRDIERVDGTRRVLYRLPELTAADRSQVVLIERRRSLRDRRIG